MNDEWRKTPGWFYVIQLSPSAEPDFLKLGWTVHIERRLLAHQRTYNAPGAVVAKMWPCTRGQEHEAAYRISKGRCSSNESELCRGIAIAEILRLADAYFAAVTRDGAPTEATVTRRRYKRPRASATAPNACATSDAKEIAARFNMPVSTVYWMADTGRIPFVNEGKPYYHRRRLLFDPVKVQAALLTGQPPAD